MNLVQNLIGDWQRLTCSHHWVRARWQDGSYGLRCADCMKAYPHTWDQIIAAAPVALANAPAGHRPPAPEPITVAARLSRAA